MAVTEAPAWLASAWRRAVLAAGASASTEEIEDAGARLVRRWQEPGRVHHNLARLTKVLAWVEEVAGQTREPELVRLAAWFHGAVFSAEIARAYAGKGGVDAEASAALAREELGALGVSEARTERVAALIGAMSRHTAPADDIDAQALCDADLAGLAAEPQKYDAYRAQIRQEYAHIPEEDFVATRLAIIARLLARRALFTSPLGRTWERAARNNLEREQAQLRHGHVPGRPEPTAAEHPAEVPRPAAEARVAERPGQVPRGAAERVALARRAAKERAAAEAAERKELRRAAAERRSARATEDRSTVDGERDGSSMSRPPTI